MKITKLHDIEIYAQSLTLAQSVYALAKQLPLTKEYALCDQIKRAALSVPANIAEGYGRKSKQDFAHFLSIALGSCNELTAFFDFIELEFKINTATLKTDYDVLAKRIYTFRAYLTTHNT